MPPDKCPKCGDERRAMLDPRGVEYPDVVAWRCGSTQWDGRPFYQGHRCRIRELEQQIAAWREAAKYLGHTIECETEWLGKDEGPQCTCGYDSLPEWMRNSSPKSQS